MGAAMVVDMGEGEEVTAIHLDNPPGGKRFLHHPRTLPELQESHSVTQYLERGRPVMPLSHTAPSIPANVCGYNSGKSSSPSFNDFYFASSIDRLEPGRQILKRLHIAIHTRCIQ